MKRTQGSSKADTTRGTGLFTEAELVEIEDRFASGMPSAAVVELFCERGVRLSEATFRKYVQQGLVPRSRRVGRKGKHRGSLGVYPAKVVRRINTIKALMEDGYTIEEIQQHFLRFADLVESVDEGLTELLSSLGEAVGEARFDERTQKSLKQEISDSRRLASELMNRLGELAETLAQPPADRYRSSGAAGSADDLL